MGIEWEVIKNSLEGFQGAQRRFQLIGEKAGVKVIDDYAHHPNEISSVSEAAKEGYPTSKVIVVFQPHRFTRMQSLWKEFHDCFNACDELYVTDIYPASEKPINGITAKNFVRSIGKEFSKPVQHLEKSEIVSRVLKTVQPGDIVLALGAGDITAYAKNFYENLMESEQYVES